MALRFFYAAAGDVEIAFLNLNADETAAQPRGGYACCSATHEWVKTNAIGADRKPNQIPHKVDRLLCRMPVVLRINREPPKIGILVTAFTIKPAPEVFILAPEVFILAPEVFILAPEVFILAPEVFPIF